MIYLITGLVLFFAVHSIAIVAPHWRDRMALRLGRPAWRGGYSLVSLAAIIMIIHGFALARAAPVSWYTSLGWMHAAARLLMLPVFPLLLAAYLPGRIQTAARHPLLAAVKFWAAAHLLANGTAADVLLFGGFLAWAVIDRISLKARAQRAVPGAPPSRWNDLVAVVLGLALYALFACCAHLWLFGVSPLG